MNEPIIPIIQTKEERFWMFFIIIAIPLIILLIGIIVL